MKPGFKTTEFIVNACVIVGAVAFAVADKLPARYAAIAAAISAGAYAVSRGLAKISPSNAPPVNYTLSGGTSANPPSRTTS